MNETPGGERIHIGFFGARNAGKSSLVNAVTDQELAVVSEVRGTTTDPVRKAMELLPLGPVVIIDTPGFDDEGSLGLERVKKTREILRTCDIAVVVTDASAGEGPADRELLALIRERGIPCLRVWNKTDLPGTGPAPEGAAAVSSLRGNGIEELKERLAGLKPAAERRPLAGDLVQRGDLCLLVCPMDEAAPKGRLILPQQQVIRDLLDHGAVPAVCRDTELEEALKRLGRPPALVITDSQAFAAVSAAVPEETPLTSFSILMARYKGFLEAAAAGVRAAEDLRDGDMVLMAEGCSHHRQCNDIGTVKIPAWLRRHTGKQLVFRSCSGREFPEDLTPYRLVIHCGGCMLTGNAVRARMEQAAEQGVPFTNYGLILARITGTLERSLRPFPAIYRQWTEGKA